MRISFSCNFTNGMTASVKCEEPNQVHLLAVQPTETGPEGGDWRCQPGNGRDQDPPASRRLGDVRIRGSLVVEGDGSFVALSVRTPARVRRKPDAQARRRSDTASAEHRRRR